MYSQTTEASKYRATVDKIAPQRLSTYINDYHVDRAMVLGLPLQQMQQGPQGPVAVPVQQSGINLRQKLEELGSDFGEFLMASSRRKDFLKTEVEIAIKKLGGWDNILPTGEWAFLLRDAKRDSDGNITSWDLPGLPFDMIEQTNTPNVVPRAFSVDIKIDQDGSGTPVYTPKNKTEQISSDPL